MGKQWGKSTLQHVEMYYWEEESFSLRSTLFVRVNSPSSHPWVSVVCLQRVINLRQVNVLILFNKARCTFANAAFIVIGGLFLESMLCKKRKNENMDNNLSKLKILLLRTGHFMFLGAFQMLVLELCCASSIIFHLINWVLSVRVSVFYFDDLVKCLEFFHFDIIEHFVLMSATILS